ncbi:hypothetical protein VTJ04DRAFT_2424 [Mycothermus thermophilus]|uniref:uncharacterized protein n=1 Tax=Humicola insolens TaxID=85995 RepID=UPI003743FEED
MDGSALAQTTKHAIHPSTHPTALCHCLRHLSYTQLNANSNSNCIFPAVLIHLPFPLLLIFFRNPHTPSLSPLTLSSVERTSYLPTYRMTGYGWLRHHGRQEKPVMTHLFPRPAPFFLPILAR